MRRGEGIALSAHPNMRRSKGVLEPSEIEACRAQGIPLAFDPVQIGWVRDGCEDDMRCDGPLSWRLSKERSETYRFRRWSERDTPTLARMLSSPVLWKYLPEEYGGQLSSEMARELIVLSNEADHHVVRAVEFSGKIIGQVRLEFRNADHSEAEISYWLHEASWGQGHGSEIVSRFAEESFKRRLDLVRLFARVHEDNLASARILIKAGFCLLKDGGDGNWRHYERRR